jgi:hypothetical protein
VRFELAIDHVSIGMSFRQVAGDIQHAKDRTKISNLTGINDLIVGQYVRVLVATNLQMIANMLADDMVWAFSLAGDGSTHRGQSFFDLRTRICLRGQLLNLHLVSIPMFDRHTVLNIFNMFCQVRRCAVQQMALQVDRHVVGRREHDDWTPRLPRHSDGRTR